MTDVDRRDAARSALFDYCEAQPAIQSLMTECQISRSDLQELYTMLLLAGAGQWRSEHFVAASALAHPVSLRYIVMRREENPLVLAVKLIAYFEQGSAMTD